MHWTEVSFEGYFADPSEVMQTCAAYWHETQRVLCWDRDCLGAVYPVVWQGDSMTIDSKGEETPCA